MKAKIGDWYEFRTSVHDGIRTFIDVTDMGILVDTFVTSFGDRLLKIQCAKWILHKRETECRRLTKAEVVLRKLENA